MGQLMEMGNNLRESGLSTVSLALVAALFMVTIVLSARELLAWYLKLNKIQDQLEALTETVLRLEQQLQDKADEEHSEVKALHFKAQATERQAFPLNH